MSDTKRTVSVPKGARKKARPRRADVEGIQEGLPESPLEMEGDIAEEEEASSSLSIQRTNGGPPPEPTATMPEKELPAATPTSPRLGSSGEFRAAVSDEYTVQSFYDRGMRKFVAVVLEFPEMKVSGQTREEAVRDLESRMDQHIQTIKGRGENLPEALQTKRYPENLDLKISQGLFRKLDMLSRQEKMGLENLVVELLAAAVERRMGDSQRSQERRQNNQSQGNSNNQRHQSQHSQGRHRRQGGGQQRGRNYHDTMDNRENFMEYVRNLEKGNWRKK